MEPSWIQSVKDDPELQHINPALLQIMYENGAFTEKTIMSLTNDLISRCRVSGVLLRELFSGEM